MPACVSEQSINAGKRKQLTKKALLGVLEFEVLVGELLAVDGLATSAIAVGEVPALNHEGLNHAVEGGPLITEALFTSSESPVDR